MIPTRRRVSIAAAVAASALLVACTSSSSSTPPRSPAVRSPTSTSVTDTTASAVGNPSTAALRTTKVTGEATTITFTAAFVKALYKHGVNTAPTGRAGLDDMHRARLPITGGSATLWQGKSELSRNTASLQHARSGLTVSTSRLRVVISDIELSLGAKPSISADIAVTASSKPSTATRIRLFDLTLTQGATRGSDGTTLGGMTATLDPEAARALDNAFDTTIFSGYGSKKAGTVSITVTT